MLADINVTLFIVRDKNAEQPRYLNTAWTMRLIRAADKQRHSIPERSANFFDPIPHSQFATATTGVFTLVHPKRT